MKRYFVKITETATEAHPFCAGHTSITLVGKGGKAIARSYNDELILPHHLDFLTYGYETEAYAKNSDAYQFAGESTKYWDIKAEVVEMEV